MKRKGLTSPSLGGVSSIINNKCLKWVAQDYEYWPFKVRRLETGCQVLRHLTAFYWCDIWPHWYARRSLWPHCNIWPQCSVLLTTGLHYVSSAALYELDCEVNGLTRPKMRSNVSPGENSSRKRNPLPLGLPPHPIT